jgi:hypothetical protein
VIVVTIDSIDRNVSSLVTLDDTNVIDSGLLSSITDAEAEELIALNVKADDSFNDIDGTMIDGTDMLRSIIVSEIEVVDVDGKTVSSINDVEGITVVDFTKLSLYIGRDMDDDMDNSGTVVI